MISPDITRISPGYVFPPYGIQKDKKNSPTKLRKMGSLKVILKLDGQQNFYFDVFVIPWCDEFLQYADSLLISEFLFYVFPHQRKF